MGVNVICTLPADVQVRYAADVIGVLAGLPTEEDHSCGFLSVSVPGVTVEASSSPSLAQIMLEGQLIDGEEAHMGYWHFEGSGGRRTFNPTSTPFWIALCSKLVDFFGGELVYADCSDSLCDYRVTQRFTCDMDDDAIFEASQERLRTLEPLTSDAIEACENMAAYRTADYA